MQHRIGTLTLRIRVRHSRSLKDKRRVVRSLKDRLKRRHNVAVAEVAGQHSRQEAEVAVAAVADSARGVMRVLEAVELDAVDMLGRSLYEAEFIEYAS